MVRKSILLVMLLAFTFLVSGCITVYTDGCCPDKQSGQCMKKAAKGETEKGPNIIDKADNWVKEKLW